MWTASFPQPRDPRSVLQALALTFPACWVSHIAHFFYLIFFTKLWKNMSENGTQTMCMNTVVEIIFILCSFKTVLSHTYLLY